MATKKAAPAKAPVKKATAAKASPAAKPTSTALTLWEKEMEQAAVAQGSTENVTGGFKSISCRGGILSVDDNPIEGNEMQVVVLASIHENQFYEGVYNPNEPASPICYAFGHDDDTMAPHAEATAKQADGCKGCVHNEWGSADIGKGKACKNVRRLICITPDALESAANMAEAESRMLKLPVTSVKNWTGYVKHTLEEDLKRPGWGVVTTIKVVPDAKSQFKVQFRFEETIDFTQEVWDAMKKKVKEAEGSIANAYPVFEKEDKPQRGNKRVIPIQNTHGKVVPAPAAAKGAVKKAKY